MLTSRDLATVRAALRFWQEEICPHGAVAAQHYLRSSGVTPLVFREVKRLRAAFHASRIRYLLLDYAQDRLASTELYASQDEALKMASQQHRVGTVLLPPATG